MRQQFKMWFGLHSGLRAARQFQQMPLRCVKVRHAIAAAVHSVVSSFYKVVSIVIK